MKKLKLLLVFTIALTAMVMLLAVSASAEDTVYSGTWGDLTWELNATTGELVISGNGEMSDFPYNGGPLSAAWEKYVGSIKTVTIKGGVTSIGNWAFFGCLNLTSITIPDSVTSIGRAAFYDCSGLTGVYITDLEAWCNLQIDLYDASPLYYARNLYLNGNLVTSLEIPNSVTSVGGCAFTGCNSLTSITIPESVTSIGSYAFSDCSSLESITVKAGNTKYHSDGNCLIETESKTLLAGCKNSIIPTDGSVTSIGNSAFRDCSSLSAVYLHSPTIVSALTSSSACGRLLENAKSVYILQSITAIPECITNAYPHANSLTHEGLSYIVYTNPTDHAYNTTLIEHDATQHKKVCECGDTVYAAHEHGAWKEHNETQHKRVCPCGDIEYADHDWNNGVITTPASHTEVGTKTYTCSVCSETKTEDVPKTTAHEYGEWQKHNATQHKRVCPCTHVEYADHDWNDGVITTPATHLEIGTKTYTCSVCSETKTEDVPKTTAHEYGEWQKHNETQHKRVCPCTDVEYADHHWDGGVVSKAATHLEEGVLTFTCVGCGETQTKVISKIAQHTYGAWTVTKESTTDAAGVQERSCACGHTDTKEIPQLESNVGAVVAIVSGSTVAVGGGGFALWWFIFRKKKLI